MRQICDVPNVKEGKVINVDESKQDKLLSISVVDSDQYLFKGVDSDVDAGSPKPKFTKPDVSKRQNQEVSYLNGRQGFPDHI